MNIATVASLVSAMESIAPTRLAESWDNVGLLVGDPSRTLDGPVLLTIDLSDQVLAEARERAASAVIAYHPPIFHPLKRLVVGPGAKLSERVAYLAAQSGIAVYSPHTALDAAPGGLTDWLASSVLATSFAAAAPGGDSRAIRPLPAPDSLSKVKIVTFVPQTALDTVRSALASAGAGLIGEYELCSYAGDGTGSFRGKPGAMPSIGKAGQLETVRELRLEMICDRRAIPLALETLRQLHPYEEPAIDVYALEPQPTRDAGPGRRVTLDHPVALYELAQRLRRHLATPAVQMAPGVGVDPMTSRLERVGVVPGAGAALAEAAQLDRCQVFITGEMKHHEVVALTASGVSVLLGGHTATERGYLPHLARRLSSLVPGVEFLTSAADHDPLTLVTELGAG
jgi:dinuclear metal center YbgI/SA1388 family protein